jgi:hypothetical protein
MPHTSARDTDITLMIRPPVKLRVSIVEWPQTSRVSEAHHVRLLPSVVHLLLIPRVVPDQMGVGMNNSPSESVGDQKHLKKSIYWVGI